MSLLLDMICAVILILFIFIGISRGVFKFTVLMLASVVCVSVSLLLSDMAAENAYNRFIKKQINAELEAACKKLDVTQEVNDRLAEKGIAVSIDPQKLKKAFDRSTKPTESIRKLLVDEGLDTQTAEDAASDIFTDVKREISDRFEVNFDSEYLNKAADQAINSFDKKATEIFYALSRDDPSYSAELLEKNILRRLILPLVRIVIFILIYIILEIGIKLILFFVGVFTRSSLTASARAGGGALGALKGGLYCLLIAYFAAQIVAVMGETNSILSLRQCNDTLLFKYFFSVFY